MIAQTILLIATAVASILTIAFLLRAYMRAIRLSFINPIGQFVLTLTNWATVPLQRVIPSIGRLELSALLPAWLIQMVLVVLTAYLKFGTVPLPLAILWWGFLGLLQQALYLLFGAVLVGVILSWVNPYAPIAPLVRAITDPFLRPIQRVIPPIGGFDFSPLILLLGIQILLMWIS